MPQYKIMFARFPGGGVERHETTDWYTETVIKMKKDPRIAAIHPFKCGDTPITMNRNRCVYEALQLHVDYLLMIDSDMEPDPKGEGGRLRYAGAKPFWETAWEFAMGHRDVPMAICAPYCGPSPHNNMYVFRFGAKNNKFRPSDRKLWSIDQFTREEVAVRGGIEEIPAAPTGLVLYDMRCFSTMMPDPKVSPDLYKGWYYYEWTDQFAMEKASTEDVTQTRDMTFAFYSTGGKKGGKMYCAWDCFAHHIKTEHVPKPELIRPDQIGAMYLAALKNPVASDEQLVMVDKGHLLPGIASLDPKTLADAQAQLERLNNDDAYRAEFLRSVGASHAGGGPAGADGAGEAGTPDAPR